MRKLFTAAAVMLMVMLLASCSYVFSSLIRWGTHRWSKDSCL